MSKSYMKEMMEAIEAGKSDSELMKINRAGLEYYTELVTEALNPISPTEVPFIIAALTVVRRSLINRDSEASTVAQSLLDNVRVETFAVRHVPDRGDDQC